METKTHVSYRVTLEGENFWFSETGYSKYNERWKLWSQGLLNEEVYGYDQALDHVKELREHFYNGSVVYENKTFVIQKVTQTVENVGIIEPLK